MGYIILKSNSILIRNQTFPFSTLVKHETYNPVSAKSPREGVGTYTKIHSTTILSSSILKNLARKHVKCRCTGIVRLHSTAKHTKPTHQHTAVPHMHTLEIIHTQYGPPDRIWWISNEHWCMVCCFKHRVTYTSFGTKRLRRYTSPVMFHVTNY